MLDDAAKTAPQGAVFLSKIAPEVFSSGPVLLRRRVVPIEDWIRDPFYIGPHAYGSRTGMWDFWKDVFEDFFNLPAKEVKSIFIVTGSNRSGKSHNTYYALVRIIYEISCFVDFPGLFGLPSTTTIVFGILSLSKGKATESGIRKLLNILEPIPYFQSVFPYKRTLSRRVSFPGIECRPGSTADDLLSDDLFGLVFDEANFTKAKAGGEFEKAKGIWVEALSRGLMTFSIRGVTRGFFALISSADSVSSFVESQIQLAKENHLGYVVTASVYKVAPYKFSQTEFFRAFCGVDDVPAFIVEEIPADVDGFITKTYGMFLEDFLVKHAEFVERVPIDFIGRFREDIEHSLRFVSGRAVSSQAAFLKNRKQFDAMFKPELKSPLLTVIPTLSLLSDDTIEDFVDEDALMALYDSGSSVYLHFDIGLMGDKTGKDGDFAGVGAVYKTEYGRIRTLLYCRVARSSSSDEIDSSKLEAIVYWLMDLGVSIKLVTKDLLARGYFSQNLIRRLGKERVGDLSLDRSDVPFLIFSHLMKKGLIEAYNYPPFKEEFPKLIHDRTSQKVLKPQGGFDDVSQALIGAVYDCFQGEGMTMETLAVEDAYAKKQAADNSDDFFAGAYMDSQEDDFYSKLLEDSDPDADFQTYADSLTPDTELKRQHSIREDLTRGIEPRIGKHPRIPPRGER